MEITNDLVQNTIDMFRSYLAVERPCKGQKSLSEEILDHFSQGGTQYTSLHYALYAMSAKARGIAFVNERKKNQLPIPNRYLDVGSGWGGMVVAVAKEGAQTCIGIDLNPTIINFAKKLSIQEKTSESCRFLLRDLCTLDPKELGQFDLITCIDVAEHVFDPKVAFANIAELCAPGGSVLIEIPNKNNPDRILIDPHHLLFASILLEREDAIKVFEEHVGNPGEYDVGYFFSLEEYVQMFEAVGFSVAQLSRSPLSKDDLYKKVLEIEREQEKHSGWSDFRKQVVKTALNSYLQRCREDYTSMADEMFLQKYGTPLLQFTLTKQANPPRVVKSPGMA